MHKKYVNLLFLLLMVFHVLNYHAVDCNSLKKKYFIGINNLPVKYMIQVLLTNFYLHVRNFCWVPESLVIVTISNRVFSKKSIT